jgi:hypothetical protein
MRSKTRQPEKHMQLWRPPVYAHLPLPVRPSCSKWPFPCPCPNLRALTATTREHVDSLHALQRPNSVQEPIQAPEGVAQQARGAQDQPRFDTVLMMACCNTHLSRYLGCTHAGLFCPALLYCAPLCSSIRSGPSEAPLLLIKWESRSITARCFFFFLQHPV